MGAGGSAEKVPNQRQKEGKPAHHKRQPAWKRGKAPNQRQRVVIRKPMKAIPNPTRMFQAPSWGTGNWLWLT
ncbi:MAG: hypothetical protein QOF36_2172 [Microbacteriaceae bacterium]|nr:hypothetical protein [Microbacteriaceae bacterium]